MVRGESDPGGGMGCNGPRNKRRHSGEGGALCHSSSSSSSGTNGLTGFCFNIVVSTVMSGVLFARFLTVDYVTQL